MNKITTLSIKLCCFSLKQYAVLKSARENLYRIMVLPSLFQVAVVFSLCGKLLTVCEWLVKTLATQLVFSTRVAEYSTINMSG